MAAQAGPVRDLEHPLGMSPPERLRVARLISSLGRELANRLEHPVSVFAADAGAAADETLVEERGERL